MTKYLLLDKDTGKYHGKGKWCNQINKAKRYSQDVFDVFGEAYARDDSSNKRFVRIEQDGKLTIME
jgi:hypothetical protein